MGIPRLVPLTGEPLTQALNAKTTTYDGLVVLFTDPSLRASSPILQPLASLMTSIHSLDASAQKTVTFHTTPTAPGSRLVLSPTGSIHGDVDDVRRFADAARKGLARARAAGIKKPILYIPSPLNNSERIKRDFKRFLEVALLGVLAEAYVPLQAREHFSKMGQEAEVVDEIGVCVEGDQGVHEAIRFAVAVEEGRRVAKDIGGADPERMTPLKCAEYIQQVFKGTDVQVSVLTDVETIRTSYPLLHAVARASLSVPRHHPAVVHLTYSPPSARENLFLVGKGVTYDTGGLDIKAGGIMRGMSRDKCGAAACAGFMKTVASLRPDIGVWCALGFVRNSVGADGYVSDEIIVSRHGVRVLVGNTDAEGRMVMADLLCEAKDIALQRPSSRLFTVATLTGHAVRAVGPYGIALDNGPAREEDIAGRLCRAGHVFGDGFEKSTLRREDFEFISASSPTEDVIQANDKASTQTNRGHQFPAAFLSVASGVVEHGLDSSSPVCYTHVDIAGSAEEGAVGLGLGAVTGAGVGAFVGAFLV
ncbi:uncharacterized protein SPPG_02872 [Spizellomyces punctatus DAOM BR117]|uniref:Cytosol aminopeptidase domain-containing protein n=1 Tax=Spizellomyces punctatus (strain DAOM BR117) TaxID=645134 RepID=A0A0L0HN91_SPIPD|nr:uncharacterized protein SPPG_02872 [Spizellomyces punctatus DAOM BR117]KND02405.1 hypothetical protein SPPG_02872 [Spizellomyces punctatus DAOM BR117]|eukprot:XP_016610444.1 hypothetical protein SPPG_02872 [Spizellomyces punctatus DAOM BR117]